MYRTFKVAHQNIWKIWTLGAPSLVHLPSPHQLRNSILSSSTPPRTNTNTPPLCPSRPRRSGSTQSEGWPQLSRSSLWRTPKHLKYMDIRTTITCAPPVPSPAPKFHPQQFNHASHEHEHATFVPLQAASKRLNTVWGMTSALAQFVMTGMFVQGFWFSSKLVRTLSQFPTQPPTNHPNKMLRRTRAQQRHGLMHNWML